METEVINTGLLGVKLVKPLVIPDGRGEIVKPFIYTDLPVDFKQAYYARSHKGVIRGMCYCEADKLVYCTKGEVLDVVLDIQTGQYESFVLSADNHLAVFIPAGYAHGYQVIKTATFNYLQTRVWNPDEEKKVDPKDFNIPFDYDQ